MSILELCYNSVPEVCQNTPHSCFGCLLCPTPSSNSITQVIEAFHTLQALVQTKWWFSQHFWLPRITIHTMSFWNELCCSNGKLTIYQGNTQALFFSSFSNKYFNLLLHIDLVFYLFCMCVDCKFTSSVVSVWFLFSIQQPLARWRWLQVDQLCRQQIPDKNWLNLLKEEQKLQYVTLIRVVARQLLAIFKYYMLGSQQLHTVAW